MVRGQPAPTFHVATPFFQQITANLTRSSDPAVVARGVREQGLLQELAYLKKLDFGLVADLSSLAKKIGRGMEAFNYLNHANLSSLQNNIANAQAGVTTGRSGSRIVEFGGRLTF